MFTSSPSLTTNRNWTLASSLMSVKEKEEAEATIKAQACTWTPEIPRWYRPFDRSVSSALDHEESLTKELLSPRPRPARTSSIDRAPANITADGKVNLLLTKDAQCGDASLASEEDRRHADGENNWQEGKGTATRMRGEGSAGEPEAGSFVVRGTGVSGVLQLLFVAKTNVGSEKITWSRA